jgi:hypothetical protein
MASSPIFAISLVSIAEKRSVDVTLVLSVSLTLIKAQFAPLGILKQQRQAMSPCQIASRSF